MTKLNLKRLSIVLILGTMLWMGCATPPPQVKEEKKAEPVKRGLFSLPAQVEKIEEDLITLRIEKPAPLKNDGKLTVALAQGVIDTCYLLEGREIFLGQAKVEVIRVSGNDVQVKGRDKTLLTVGSRVNFPLEKKFLALKDFEVITGSNKDAARYVQEDITSLLVDSGQFNVVERSKLGTVLEEIELGQSGVIDPATVQKAGMLLGAEIILTGTLAAAGEQWNVNLRLINTATGLIFAAIHKLGPIHELVAAGPIRAYDNIDGGFESGDPKDAGWEMGRIEEGITGVGGYQRVYLDNNQAANGSKQSLAMDFKMGSQRTGIDWMRVAITNSNGRALAQFRGVKFFIKGTDNFTFRFRIIGMRGTWGKDFPVSKEWREVRIPFSSLSQGVPPSGKAPTLTLDLRNTTGIQWTANDGMMRPGTRGTIRLDEISFY